MQIRIGERRRTGRSGENCKNAFCLDQSMCLCARFSIESSYNKETDCFSWIHTSHRSCWIVMFGQNSLDIFRWVVWRIQFHRFQLLQWTLWTMPLRAGRLLFQRERKSLKWAGRLKSHTNTGTPIKSKTFDKYSFPNQKLKHRILENQIHFHVVYFDPIYTDTSKLTHKHIRRHTRKFHTDVWYV